MFWKRFNLKVACPTLHRSKQWVFVFLSGGLLFGFAATDSAMPFEVEAYESCIEDIELSDSELLTARSDEEYSLIQRAVEVRSGCASQFAVWLERTELASDYRIPLERTLSGLLAELSYLQALSGRCLQARGWYSRYKASVDFIEASPEASKIKIVVDKCEERVKTQSPGHSRDMPPTIPIAPSYEPVNQSTTLPQAVVETENSAVAGVLPGFSKAVHDRMKARIHKANHAYAFSLAAPESERKIAYQAVVSVRLECVAQHEMWLANLDIPDSIRTKLARERGQMLGELAVILSRGGDCLQAQMQWAKYRESSEFHVDSSQTNKIKDLVASCVSPAE